MAFSVYLHENFRGYIDKYPDDPLKWRPNIQCDIDLNSIDVFVSTKQIFAISAWLQNFNFIQRKMKYHQLIEEMKDRRPKCDMDGSKNRAVWWRYLIDCAIRHNRNKKKNRFKLENIVNFEARKKDYMELYKRKMRPHQYRYWIKGLDSTEQKELSQYEMAFPFSQILMFRALAIAELKKEMEKRDKYQEDLKEKGKQRIVICYKVFYYTKS